MTSERPGGTVKLGQYEIGRIGYGAMQLEHVDTATATAVLRRVVERGVNHLDTASFYGHTTVNQHIRAALHPYADDMVIVSKVGARRVDARCRWRSRKSRLSCVNRSTSTSIHSVWNKSRSSTSAARTRVPG